MSSGMPMRSMRGGFWPMPNERWKMKLVAAPASSVKARPVTIWLAPSPTTSAAMTAPHTAPVDEAGEQAEPRRAGVRP